MDCTLGTSLSTWGPGLSAFIRLTWEPPVRGSSESRNTRTPMPPIQWVKLRQNRMPLGRPSNGGQDAGTGGGEARNGLKHGVHGVRDAAGEDKGHRAHHTDEQPAERRGGKALPHIEDLAAWA